MPSNCHQNLRGASEVTNLLNDQIEKALEEFLEKIEELAAKKAAKQPTNKE